MVRRLIIKGWKMMAKIRRRRRRGVKGRGVMRAESVSGEGRGEDGIASKGKEGDVCGLFSGANVARDGEGGLVVGRRNGVGSLASRVLFRSLPSDSTFEGDRRVFSGLLHSRSNSGLLHRVLRMSAESERRRFGDAGRTRRVSL